MRNFLVGAIVAASLTTTANAQGVTCDLAPHVEGNSTNKLMLEGNRAVWVFQANETLNTVSFMCTGLVCHSGTVPRNFVLHMLIDEGSLNIALIGLERGAAPTVTFIGPATCD